jgi:chemotaxis protein MotB
VLFPEGGYQLSPNGKQALNQYVPKLQNLQNAKVVVYGYTDNLQVGPALQRAGIANNIGRNGPPITRDATGSDQKAELNGNPELLSRAGTGSRIPQSRDDMWERNTSETLYH